MGKFLFSIEYVLIAGLVTVALYAFLGSELIKLGPLMLLIAPLIFACLIIGAVFARFSPSTFSASALPFGRPFHDALPVVLFVAMISLMGYGFLRWPRAPLKMVNGVVVDKSGSPHPPSELPSFNRWELILFSVGTATMLAAAGAGVLRKRDMRKEQGV